MMEQALQEEMIAFFEHYLDFYKDFVQLEGDKYEDMLNGRVHLLDGYVRREQAYMLKSRGLEQERDRLVACTPKPKATFRQLIPLFDGECNAKVQTIYDDLSLVLKEMKQINSSCNDLLSLKLHKVEKDREKLKNHPELRKLYDNHANRVAPSNGAFSKKI